MARSLSLFLLLLCNFSATEDDATRLESNELTDRRIASRRVADDYIERMSGALLWTPKIQIPARTFPPLVRLHKLYAESEKALKRWQALILGKSLARGSSERFVLGFFCLNLFSDPSDTVS